jgi:4'-phosphopantetheinyl transferase
MAQPAPILRALFHLLSTDECERAARFRFKKDRERFIVARAVLRIILSHYLKLEPAQLRFTYNHYGKPALVGTPGDTRLCFNLSHSNSLALFAFTSDRRVGLDLEYVREDFAWAEIAELFFSEREIKMLRALPASMQAAGFFNCWTRKEAYLKAIGEGVSFPLSHFDVLLTPGGPAMLLNFRGKPQETSHWSLRELMPGMYDTAAVVVEGHDWQLKCLEWSESEQGLVPSG